ncbi:MAG: hypothetical protein Solivirus4_15 [Solivirus sp.]|uniref:F-box domain-containing protein n=1 Tax=Solivirus sp. TaxID=2487772 RepID=A0A3G5AHJ1_9VIRU|nr:MAG: hypothetical protein Solivirus4_15 [Solivirus sp.]
MTTRLGPDNDLVAKQILLNIEDDTEFMNTCQTSTTMRDLCSHQDLWEERLKRYYPKTVATKIQTGLTWREFYPIASLFNQYSKLNDEINTATVAGVDHDLEVEIALLARRIGRYLTKFLFDYSIVLNNNFVHLFKQDYGIEDEIDIIIAEFLTVASSKNLIDQTKALLQLLRENKFGGFRGNFIDYLDNGSNDFIIEVLEGDEIWNYYNLLIKKSNDKERIKDYIIKAIRKVPSTSLFRDIMVPDIVNNTGEIADWAWNHIGLNELSFMTNYISYNMLNRIKIDDNIFVYIVSRKMLPNFEYILPTQTVLDHLRKHGTNLQAVRMNSIYSVVRTFAIAKIFPPPWIVEQIPQEIRERYKSRYDFFVELSKKYN